MGGDNHFRNTIISSLNVSTLVTLKAVFQESQNLGSEGTSHVKMIHPSCQQNGPSTSASFSFIQSESGFKIHNEYSVSCETTSCWYGTSNQRAIFASESVCVYGQQPMSPSRILNAYQRRWQAILRPESSTSSSCVVLYQATKIHRVIPSTQTFTTEYC